MKRVSTVFSIMSQRIYQMPQDKRVLQWVHDNGDKTLRLNYDLDENSVVFDLGGYEGQWSSDVFSKYCCTIHIFEPVNKFADSIKNRFAKNPKIVVHRFGLANDTKKAKISLASDGSSIYKQGEKISEIQLIKASDFLKKYNITFIDLIKINIEGAEYDLLVHFIESKFIMNIKDIQVQFHDFVPEATSRMKMIQNELSKTHRLTYQYPFVWENWEKIN
jgi:FkbM family methyltransferase